MSEFKVKQRLSEFAWVDQNDGLHFNIPEMLKELGVSDTPENRAALIEVCLDLFREAAPRATIVQTP